MPCDVAGIALGFFAERKHRAFQLVLSQGEQEITLILAQIASAPEQNAPIVAVLESSEMAGGNELRAELVCAINQSAELQILIAHDARIWRAAGFVFVGKILNDLRLKLFCFVDEIVRDAELVTDRACIGNGLRS